MNGEYKEKLPFGTGDLIVTKNTFYIEFYFSGPDLRHNGTFKRINKDEIDLYIKAYCLFQLKSIPVFHFKSIPI